MIGKTLGHFRITDKVGAGGMGQVFKAVDMKLGRTVAIKTLLPDRVADGERKRRFIQEAQAASALNHPNIVVIHEIGEEAGVDFIVMEFVEGRTLDALIPPEVEQVLRRALRKDAARRFQHMDDLKVALEELREESESGKLARVEAPKASARRWWVGGGDWGGGCLRSGGGMVRVTARGGGGRFTIGGSAFGVDVR